MTKYQSQKMFSLNPYSNTWTLLSTRDKYYILGILAHTAQDTINLLGMLPDTEPPAWCALGKHSSIPKLDFQP